jgi:hypothetical protein
MTKTTKARKKYPLNGNAPEVYTTICQRCGQHLPAGRRNILPPPITIQYGQRDHVEVTIHGEHGALSLEPSVEGPTVFLDKNGQGFSHAAVSLKATGHLRGYVDKKDGSWEWFPAKKPRTTQARKEASHGMSN